MMSPLVLDSTQQTLADFMQWLMIQNYQFTTVTPETHARVLHQNSAPKLARHLRDAFGWNRPFTSELLPAAWHQQLQQAGWISPCAGQADDMDQPCWQSEIRLSSLDGLLLAHSRYPTNQGASVFFGPDTYRFVRAISQSHTLLAALASKPAPRILELCGGAGPAALWLARRYPQSTVIASDINDAALRLIAVNTVANRLQVQPVNSNLYQAFTDPAQDASGGFDLIVANPPYLVDDEQRLYRHGGDDLGTGLAQAIVAQGLNQLRAGGYLLLYTGIPIIDGHDGFAERLRAMLPVDGRFTLDYSEIDPDVFGEELLRPAYAGVDRLAAICAVIHQSQAI